MTLRVIAAAGVLISGLVHLKLWFDGFGGIPVIGPAFMLNAVAGVVIAALLVLWRHWAPSLLAVGFGASTLGAFIISLTVGLFGIHEAWTGAAALTAAASEVVAIVAGALVLRSEHPWRSDRQQPEVRRAQGRWRICLGARRCQAPAPACQRGGATTGLLAHVPAGGKAAVRIRTR